MEYKSLCPNIGVKNVNETVKFYTEILGFKLMMNVPETGNFVWAMVGSGEVNIMLQELQSLADEYPQLKGKPTNTALTFYVKTANFQELYEQLKDTPHLVKSLHTTPYGAKEFAIVDNNGYILTITDFK